METKNNIFENLDDEKMESIKAGKSEVVAETQACAVMGDGALLKCCIKEPEKRN